MNKWLCKLHCWWYGHAPCAESGYKSWYCCKCGSFLGGMND